MLTTLSLKCRQRRRLSLNSVRPLILIFSLHDLDQKPSQGNHCTRWHPKAALFTLRHDSQARWWCALFVILVVEIGLQNNRCIRWHLSRCETWPIKRVLSSLTPSILENLLLCYTPSNATFTLFSSVWNMYCILIFFPALKPPKHFQKHGRALENTQCIESRYLRILEEQNDVGSLRKWFPKGWKSASSIEK